MSLASFLKGLGSIGQMRLYSSQYCNWNWGNMKGWVICLMKIPIMFLFMFHSIQMTQPARSFIFIIRNCRKINLQISNLTIMLPSGCFLHNILMPKELYHLIPLSPTRQLLKLINQDWVKVEIKTLISHFENIGLQLVHTTLSS